MPIQSLFFGVFFVFIILKTGQADLPGCHFLETVNITSGQMLLNGSFLYQDLKLPVNLTGQYNYITTETGFEQRVRSHLRGCVCHVKPCIWICCRFKDWDESNGICTDDLMEELREINPFLKVTLSNGSLVRRNVLKDFIVLRDRMRLYDMWERDKYTLFENGSVLLRRYNTIYLRGYDCLHPNQLISGNTESFAVAFHESRYEKPRKSLPKSIKFMWLSEVFLALTIAVYLYVKKLRNLHGKCFICYMITTFIYFINKLLESNLEGLQLCVLQGYFTYFFLFAKFTWLLAMSHNLWRGFTSVNRVESEYNFRAYSIFAWGSPAIIMGVFFLIDHIWGEDPNKLEWVPGMGWQDCKLKGNWSYWGYISLPLLIIVVLNTTLFLLTTISIIRVKFSLRHFSDQNDRARNLNSRLQTFTVLLRLFILMNIQWSLRVISFYAHSRFFLKICKYCNSCIGIIIFVLFVLKPSTLKLLMER